MMKSQAVFGLLAYGGQTMINKVILLGNLGANPEVKQTGSGSPIVNLRVATSERWVDKQGEKHERTEWHRVVVFGKQAEAAGKYLTKGRQVYIEGRLQTKEYEKDGQKRYSTDVICDTIQFLGGKDKTETEFV